MSGLTRLKWAGFLAYHTARERWIPFESESGVRALAERRMRGILRYATARIPYYQEVLRAAGLEPRDVRTLEDLARLPLLTKEELVGEPGLCSAPGRGEGLEIQSSGTSGRSRTIFHTGASLFLNLAGGYRMRAAMAPFTGRLRGCREALIVRRGSVHEQIRRFYAETGPRLPDGGTGGEFILPPAGDFREELRRLNEYQADVVRGYGSYLGAFYRWVYNTGAELARPKAVVYGADGMPDADRQLIEEGLRIPVFSVYQAVEALRIGYQCPLRQGLHVYADQVHVRVVDGQGRALTPPATGDLVISNLINPGTVLLNYKLGDVVTLSAEPCACGRSGLRILRIEGRNDDVVWRPDGAAIHALTLMAALQKFSGVVQVQVEQKRTDAFTLRVVPCAGQDWPSLARALGEAMRQVLGYAAEIEVQSVPSIPAGPNKKVRAVISHVQPPGAIRHDGRSGWVPDARLGARARRG